MSCFRFFSFFFFKKKILKEKEKNKQTTTTNTNKMALPGVAVFLVSLTTLHDLPTVRV